MAMATSLQQPLPSVPKVAIVRGPTVYKRDVLFCQKWYTAISGKVFRKSARDDAERYCGWF